MKKIDNFIQPEISVMIPVYGVEKYIEKCLRSIFDNTIADRCEFIIVNDCTPDSSMDIVERVSKDYPALQNNIHIINHEKNKGLAASRNTALSYANGKYIVNVDSDDWVEPDYLEELYNAIEHNNADIVCCGFFRDTLTKSKKIKPYFSDSNVEVMKNLLSNGDNRSGCFKIFKRKLFIENNISWVDGLNAGEDFLICVKLFSVASKIVTIDKCLYHYIQYNPNSICHDEKQSENFITQLMLVENKIEEWLEKFSPKYDSAIPFMRKEIKIDLLMTAQKKKRMQYYKMWPATDKISIFYTKNRNKQIFALFLKMHLYKLTDILIWLRGKKMV